MYEDSDSLITIPSLPIQIDWGFAEEYYPYLSDSFLLNKSEEEKDKLEYLINTGLLYGQDKGKSKHLSRTSLGWFFYNAIEKELHVAKSVMGFFFEYKLYEYYVENPYLNKYRIVEHSKIIFEDKGDPYKDVEIDLILRKDDDEKDYIAIEVKSLNRLDDRKKENDSNRKDRFTQLKKQIEKQIDTMENKYFYAKEYHLCLYTPNTGAFIKNLYPYQKNMLGELRRLFDSLKMEFKVFLIKANYNQKRDERGRINSNPYQQLMKDKLELGTNFKEIKF